MSNEELIKEIRGGKLELMAELYENNRGFIYGIITHLGIAADNYEDAAQEAYFGLDEAVKRYDESKGFKFLTFAQHYIRQAIQRGQDHALYVPEYVYTEARKIKKARAELTSTLKRTPTAPELAQKTGLSVKKIKYILSVTKPVKSIYEPVKDGDGLIIGDIIQDESIDFENTIAAADERERVRDAVRALPDKEKAVIEMCYFRGKTAKQAAERLNITVIDIGNIKRKAFDKLQRLIPHTIDTKTAFYRYTGVNSFKRTWTSSTERAVLDREYTARQELERCLREIIQKRNELKRELKK